MNDGTECDHLPEPQRRLCRGDIDLQQFRTWTRTGVAPSRFLETPRQGADVSPAEAPPEFDICRHRGDEVGRLEAAGNCACDRTIYACPLHGSCVSLFHPAQARPLIAEARRRGLQNCADCPDMQPLPVSCAPMNLHLVAGNPLATGGRPAHDGIEH